MLIYGVVAALLMLLCIGILLLLAVGIVDVVLVRSLPPLRPMTAITIAIPTR